MIRLVEVGPRDGLQNEARTVPTPTKVAFVDALSGSGLPEIEVSAFVSPKWIPQLADAEEVFRRIRRAPGVTYSALVPNERGLERALGAKADKIAVFTAASETFNRKNINASIAESIQRFVPVVEGARKAGLPVRGYVSTAFWCPYEGKIRPAQAAEVIRQLVDLGVDEISVGDTIGKAQPADVRELLGLLGPGPALGSSRIAMHFHDTYHHALENVRESWRLGIETFDASTGGIGGCPYAPGASGNVSTEAVVGALEAQGARTGIRLEALEEARRVIAPALGAPGPG
jgi:hydroxymethylglutaryl-CoA lyase